TLAGRAERVGRRAGDLAVREQLRPAVEIGALVGDVDGQVADQADAALGRVGAQLPPLPLEAHLVGERLPAGELGPAAGPEGMAIPKTRPGRIQIQGVSPQVDCGRYPIKRTVGDTVEVTARIFRDGHETLGAAVRHKGPGATHWSEMPLEPLGNDVWAGSFEV